MAVKTKCMELVRLVIPTEVSGLERKLTPEDKAEDDEAGMRI